MVELVDTEKSLTDDEFREFERLFPRQIPNSFKAHYRADNGGSPSEEEVEAEKWGPPLHGFNPIKYGSLTIEKLIERYGDIEFAGSEFGLWKKSSFIPFAYDAGGNPIFLSLRDKDYGYILHM